MAINTIHKDTKLIYEFIGTYKFYRKRYHDYGWGHILYAWFYNITYSDGRELANEAFCVYSQIIKTIDINLGDRVKITTKRPIKIPPSHDVQQNDIKFEFPIKIVNLTKGQSWEYSYKSKRMELISRF